MILDLFSRCIVGWMVARRETSALAQQLIARSIERTGIAAGQLTLHSDRGAPMTAHSFDALLMTLGIEASRSRPRVSNDNAFSESGFKTLKYQPDYPGRFRDSHHARSWVREFVVWYNQRHRHEGLNGVTPDEVYSGSHVALAHRRQRTLDDAFARHPDRWITVRRSSRTRLEGLHQSRTASRSQPVRTVFPTKLSSEPSKEQSTSITPDLPKRRCCNALEATSH